MQKLRHPEHFREAVRHFSTKGEVIVGIEAPWWEDAKARLTELSEHYVDGFRSKRVHEYVDSIGILDNALQASYDYSLWSCCSEYSALAARGVNVRKISLKRLAPYMGRGQLPTLEKTTLCSVVA